MGEVAAAVLAHHERIDGRGYPDGLAAEGIPITARILAVAEVYDVLTAPDSYRIPMTADQAEQEMRNVAGTQLDGRLVFLFATKVLRGRYASDHNDRIADLETELLVQRRVRGALDAPFVLGPPSRSSRFAIQRTASRQVSSAAGEQHAEVDGVAPALEAEHGVADQLHEVVERVDAARANCAHSGSPSIGKNVPATRKSGVITALMT